MSEPLSLSIGQIQPNPDQPRRNFDPETLRSLALSIKENGVLQPIVVRPLSLDPPRYQIVAGERRWRAAKLVGLATIPAVVRPFDDAEATAAALIENLLREDLNPIEEALGYRRLQEEHGMRQDEIAATVGKSRSAIANSLRLLALPQQVQEWLRDGKISSGQARPLVGLERERILPLAKRIIREGLSARQIERLVAAFRSHENSSSRGGRGRASRNNRDVIDQRTLHRLETRFGRKVVLRGDSRRGLLSFEYYDKSDLTVLVDLLLRE